MHRYKGLSAMQTGPSSPWNRMAREHSDSALVAQLQTD